MKNLIILLFYHLKININQSLNEIVCLDILIILLKLKNATFILFNFELNSPTFEIQI